jgi:hypothetical protein
MSSPTWPNAPASPPRLWRSDWGSSSCVCAAESVMSSAAISMPARPAQAAGVEIPLGIRAPVVVSSNAPL